MGQNEKDGRIDVVNHPEHYATGEIECIEAIQAALGDDGFQAYCAGNILKYIWRYKRKNGLQDLQKAEVYLGWLMEEVQLDEQVEADEKLEAAASGDALGNALLHWRNVPVRKLPEEAAQALGNAMVRADVGPQRYADAMDGTLADLEGTIDVGVIALVAELAGGKEA